MVAVNAPLSVDVINKNTTGFVTVNNLQASSVINTVSSSGGGDITLVPNNNLTLFNPTPRSTSNVVSNAPIKVDNINPNTASVITMPDVTMGNSNVGSITGTSSPLTIQGVPGPGSRVSISNLTSNQAITTPGITLPDGSSELKISAVGDNPGSQQITLAAGTAGVVIPYNAPFYGSRLIPAGGNGVYFDLPNSLIAPAGTGSQTNKFGADSIVTNVINTASGDLYLSPLGNVNIPTNSTLAVDNVGSLQPFPEHSN